MNLKNEERPTWKVGLGPLKCTLEYVLCMMQTHIHRQTHTHKWSQRLELTPVIKHSRSGGCRISALQGHSCLHTKLKPVYTTLEYIPNYMCMHVLGEGW